MDREIPWLCEPEPEAEEWMNSVCKEWEEIFARFKADTEALIRKSGGPKNLMFRTYNGEPYQNIIPILDYYGRHCDAEGE